MINLQQKAQPNMLMILKRSNKLYLHFYLVVILNIQRGTTDTV